MTWTLLSGWHSQAGKDVYIVHQITIWEGSVSRHDFNCSNFVMQPRKGYIATSRDAPPVINPTTIRSCTRGRTTSAIQRDKNKPTHSGISISSGTYIYCYGKYAVFDREIWILRTVHITIQYKSVMFQRKKAMEMFSQSYVLRAPTLLGFSI